MRKNKIFKNPKDLRNFLVEERSKDHSIVHKPRKPLVCVSGGFDPLHIGHLRYIQHSSLLGDLVVIVNGDKFLINKKGKPFMSLEERMEIIAGLEGVKYVTSWDLKDEKDKDTSVSKCLEILRPDIFSKGGDRSTVESVPEAYTCEKIKCSLILGVGGEEKIQSSSNLLSRNKSVSIEESSILERIDPFELPNRLETYES